MYENPDVGVAFIYFSYKESNQQTPSNLIANTLRQLLLQKCTIRDELLSLYNRHANQKTRPYLSEFTHLLLIVARTFSKVFLIIDALDECPEADSVRTIFLREIQILQQKTNILITSRHIPSIERTLSNAMRIDIEPDDDDIKNYIEQRLQSLQSFKSFVLKDPNFPSMVAASVAAKAKKMFLLARLQVESLMKLITLRKIKMALTQLPESLDSMYDDVLDRIQAQDPECTILAMHTLGWTYYARRPLTIQELQLALAIEPEDSSLDRDGIPERDTIVSVCAGMVSIQAGGILAFIHYTVREYLERWEDKVFADLRVRIAHICLTYLLFDEFAAGPCPDDKSFESRLITNPFFTYAASFWGYHAQGLPEHEIKQLIMDFLTNDPKRASCVQAQHIAQVSMRYRYPNYSQKYPDELTGLGLAAGFGLDVVVKNILATKVDIEARDGFGRTALHCACEEGHAKVIQCLIENGADKEAQVEIDYFLRLAGYTPLHCAVARGHIKAAEVLLINKTNVNIKGFRRESAAHLAAEHGHMPILQLLDSYGAHLDTQDAHGGTPLYRAAENGLDDIIRFLLDRNANVNTQTQLIQTPLLRAAENGLTSTTRLLLEHGADWTIKDFLGWTPVYRSMDMGHTKTTKVLKDWAAAARKKEKELQGLSSGSGG